MRPDVVVGRHLGLRGAVAAGAGEDHHEEVHDAVLVGVVGVVVDLVVGDQRRVIDGLAGRPAAGVDVLQRTDAGQRTRQRRALAVEPVVGRVARQLVPAVGDPRAAGVGAERRLGVQRAGRVAGLREVVGPGPAGGGDPVRGHRRVREQLPEGDLLVEVERRARVGGIVDLARQLGRGGGGDVVRAVGVVDGHDRERAVAVAGGLEAARRRDHLRAVRDRVDAAAGGRQRRRRGEVLPGDLGVLGERVRGRLDDLQRDAGRAVDGLGGHRRHGPRGGRERRPVRRRHRHGRADERRRAVVEHAQRERVRLARLHPALRGHEVVLEHHVGGWRGDGQCPCLLARRRSPARACRGRSCRPTRACLE